MGAALGWGALRSLARASARDAEARARLAFVGDDAVDDPADGVISPDGVRRLRIHEGLARYEELSLDGRCTIASYLDEPRGLLRRFARRFERADARDALIAEVHGRAILPVCFLGAPHRGEPRALTARWLRARPLTSGVLLERFDEGHRPIGDTLHPDLDAARTQVRLEYGAHAGRLRPGTAPVLGAPAPRAWW